MGLEAPAGPAMAQRRTSLTMYAGGTMYTAGPFAAFVDPQGYREIKAESLKRIPFSIESTSNCR